MKSSNIPPTARNPLDLLVHWKKHHQLLKQATVLSSAAALLASGFIATAPPASAALCAPTSVTPVGTTYTVNSIEELTWIRDQVNSGTDFSGKTVVLSRSITNIACTWDAGIGGPSGRAFAGTFDGNGFIIDGLNISLEDSANNYGGLFGRATGTIQDVGFTGDVSAIKRTSSSGGPYLGGLVGSFEGTTISNSFASGSVTCGNPLVANQCFVGGLAGKVLSISTISRSFASGTVTANLFSDAAAAIGGLIGINNGAISDAYALGNVQTSGSGRPTGLGGVVGENFGSSAILTRTYAIGQVSGTLQYCGGLGGLIGRVNDSATVNDSSYWNQSAYSSVPTGIGVNANNCPPGGGYDTNAAPKTSTQLMSLSTYSSPDWSGQIASGFDASVTWGICSTVNSGYPFLTTFYASNPCAVSAATPSPTSVPFGSQGVGTTSSAQSVEITSTGTANLVFGAGATSLSGTDSGMFTIDSDGCSNQTLSPTPTVPYSCTIDVTFSPTSAGSKTATLEIASNDPSSPTQIALTGTGTTAAGASASPTSVDFGSVDVNTTSSEQTVIISSTGNADLVFGSGAATLTGADSSMFAIATDNCSGQIIAVRSSCSVILTFTPTSVGSKSATLSVTSNDPSSPLTVALAGSSGPVTVPPATFTFWFDTSTGGTCLDSVQVIDTHIYTLPDSTVACVPEGSTLVGWSIRGQSWNFAPGAEVVVSGDQTFTAVAQNPSIFVTYDSNVGMETECLSVGSDATSEGGRSREALIQRTSGSELAMSAPCAPVGFTFIGWTDANTPSGSGTAQEGSVVIVTGAPIPVEWTRTRTDPINAVRLYALWRPATT